MTGTSPSKKNNSLLLRMHPLQRILFSLSLSAIVFLFIRHRHLEPMVMATLLWVTFALTFIIASWVVFFKMPVNSIVEKANKEDGSRFFVLVSILISSFASMFTVLILIISKDQLTGQGTIPLILSILSMIVSWVMVHTIFTFHYAHLYYFKDSDDTVCDEPLKFPNEKKPNYLDFAYFSFVIGMTFQVSDIEINSRKIRKTVLAHGLLSFALNTFVVALTINLIAGLKR